MDAMIFASLVAACSPLVHPDTARAIVDVESGFNAYAIGVVGGALERQPRTAGEAISTALSLRASGWNYSVGLAQINVANLPRLGLTVQTALDPCRSLAAMQTVLGECHERVG